MVSVIQLVIVILVMAFVGCGGRMPEDLGVTEGIFAPCPDKPNCISSFAKDADHHVAPIAIADSPATAWMKLQTMLENDKNVSIVTSSDHYLHAVYTSSLMRYRDDVEFLLQADHSEIAVRSASRVGHGDMGVNRARIEALRHGLTK